MRKTGKAAETVEGRLPIEEEGVFKEEDEGVVTYAGDATVPVERAESGAATCVMICVRVYVDVKFEWDGDGKEGEEESVVPLAIGATVEGDLDVAASILESATARFIGLKQTCE